MISKLCSYNRRTEFILKVLGDVIRESEQQIIMLRIIKIYLLIFIRQ